MADETPNGHTITLIDRIRPPKYYRVTCTYLYMLAEHTDDKGVVTPAHPESGGGQTREIEAESIQAALDEMERRMIDEHQAISVAFESVWFLY